MWDSLRVLSGHSLLGLFLLLGLLLLTRRAAGRSASMTARLRRETGWLGQRVQSRRGGPGRTAAGLHQVSEHQALRTPA